MDIEFGRQLSGRQALFNREVLHQVKAFVIDL